MPHDSKGSKLDEGDVVTMKFAVKQITSEGENACNVGLEAIPPEGIQGEYAPYVSCNSKLTTLYGKASD